MPVTGRFVAFATATLFVFSFSLLTANAATFTVTKIADTSDGACDADCSLREAVVAAADTAESDTIVFSPLFNSPQTINQTLAGSVELGDMDLLGDITIIGPGRLLTVNGMIPDERVFDLPPPPSGGTVTISGMTISGGQNDQIGGAMQSEANLILRFVRVTGTVCSNQGGAIDNNGGTLTIVDSLIDNNRTTGGNDIAAGILNRGNGTLTIANTTITQNSAADDGGGVYSENGTVNLNNVTIVGNSSADDGGGIFQSGNTVVNIRNSIVAGNTTPDLGRDVLGTFVTNGNNLIGNNQGAEVSFPGGNPNANNDRVGTPKAPLDAMLGPLQNNGGPTDTIAPLAGSPALENGNSCVVTACGVNDPPNPLTLDQRGFPRLVGNAVDIGALEALATTAAHVAAIWPNNGFAGSWDTVSRIVLGTPGAPEQRIALSSSFGFYSFEALEVGQAYIVTVQAKRLNFAVPSRVVVLDDKFVDIDFVADP